jgi:anaerobic magnesium-protoporphyrin IX monomethyl ester cyclase
MTILLLSMPDSFEHTSPIAMRMPSAALTSLAANVDPWHNVAVADLVLAQRKVQRTIERLIDRYRPDIAGLSVMSFQRKTAMKLISLLRRLKPGIRIVVGGYDPSLAPEPYEAPESGVDWIVRGEGESTLRELLRSIDGNRGCANVAGLSYRVDGRFVRNPPRPPERLDAGTIRPPARRARVLSGYTLLGRQIDMVETSRGCTFDCSFCSIVAMRGRNFHAFPLERVLADIADARSQGARVVFFVDDNIALHIRRLESLCREIVARRLNDVDYIVQAMTSSIAEHGDVLAPLMRKAGFRYVFLGIENILDEDLAFLRAGAKNVGRDKGRPAESVAAKAIEILHGNGIYVVGGMIVGNPDDTAESIERNLAFAEKWVDWPYIQHPTPYPGTPLARQYRESGFIVSEDIEEYDGTTAVVKSRYLDVEEIEFLRWRSERWMKTRHIVPAFRHSPVFVLRNWRRMLGHTFRGHGIRWLLGLEDDKHVFHRYQAIRRAERHYLPDVPDPLPASVEDCLTTS